MSKLHISKLVTFYFLAVHIYLSYKLTGLLLVGHHVRM